MGIVNIVYSVVQNWHSVPLFNPPPPPPVIVIFLIAGNRLSLPSLCNLSSSLKASHHVLNASSAVARVEGRLTL